MSDESEAKTNMEILRKADWGQLERDVVERIRILRATAEKGGEGEVWDQIANDLIVPNIALLAQFCSNVEIKEEEGSGG